MMTTQSDAAQTPRQTSSSLRTAVRLRPAESFYSAILVSRILYAVLIVGFIGYYLDKAWQIIRQ